MLCFLLVINLVLLLKVVGCSMSCLLAWAQTPNQFRKMERVHSTRKDISEHGRKLLLYRAIAVVITS